MVLLGILSFNIPIGPGIGAREVAFRPVVRGGPSYLHQYTAALINPIDNYPIKVCVPISDLLPGGWLAPYAEQTDHPVEKGCDLDFSLGPFSPGYLELGVPGQFAGVDTTNRFRVSDLSGTFRNTNRLPTNIDVTKILARFGYTSSTGIADAPTATPGISIPSSVSSPLLRLASGRYLVIGLVGANFPAPPITDQRYIAAKATPIPFTITYPGAVLVVDGDVAYEFAMNNIYTDPKTGRPPLAYARISTAEQGTFPVFFNPISRLSYRLTRIRNDSGDELRFTYTSARDFRVDWLRNSVSTGTAIQIVAGINSVDTKCVYEGGQSPLSYTIKPGVLIHDQTSEEITYGSNPDPSCKETVFVHKQNGQIVRQIDATWSGEFSYLETDGLNGAPLRGRTSTIGVNRLEEKVPGPSGNWVTRATTYDRSVPRPLLAGITNSGVTADPCDTGTEQFNPIRWDTTDFSCKVTHPDGTSVLYTYAPPTDPMLDSIGYHAFNKHLVAKENWYGSNGTLAKTIAHSGWEVKAIGDTALPGLTGRTNAVPYPTHSVMHDLIMGCQIAIDLQNWDDNHFAWTLISKVVTDLTGAGPVDRSKTIVLESNPSLFLWGRSKEERTVGLPPVFRTWDTDSMRVLDETMGEAPGPRIITHSIWTSGLLTQAFAEFPGDPESRRGMNYGYDKWGQLIAMWPLDPSLASLKSTRLLDGFGRVLSSTDANDLSTTFGWDAAGRLTSITPPGGEIASEVNYDAAPLTLIQTRGAQKTTHVYNGWGDPLRVIRETGSGALSHQAFGYDTKGRKIWTSVWQSGNGSSVDWTAPLAPGDTPGSAAWTETTNQCIAWQRLSDGTSICRAYKAILHPAGSPVLKNTHFGYDEHNRLIHVVNPTNEAKTIAYTNRNAGYTRATTVVPSNGVSLVTTEAFDFLGRLSRTTDAKGQVTDYFYDDADRIKTVTQWSGAQGTLPRQDRNWNYDALGRLVSIVQPENGTTSYSNFDVLGKPQTTNYNGRIVRSSFDGLGRLKSVRADDGTVNQVFSYDEGGKAVLANGKLTRAVVVNGGIRTLAYNGAYGLNGRLTSVTLEVDGQTFSQAMGYDGYGRLNRRTYPDGKVQVVNYQNATGNPDWTNFNSGRVANFAYHDTTWGLLTVAFQNGASTQYSYRSDQATLATLAQNIPGKPSKNWTYDYDGAGRLLTDGKDSYTYDELGRLKTAAVADLGDGAKGLFQTFDYDAFGNRIFAKTETVTNWTTPNLLPESLSPSLTLRPGLDTVTANATFSGNESALLKNQMPAFMNNGAATGAQYDAQGNLDRVYSTPNDSTTNVSMVYDALARVISCFDSKRGTTEKYRYDDQGLRVAVEEWQGTTLIRKKFNIYNEQRQLISQWVAE